MSRLSVRSRVTLASALVLAIGLAVLTLGIETILESQLNADASSALRERAAAQLATLALRDGRVVLRDPPADAALDQQAWVFARGRILHRPRAPAAVQAAAVALARRGGTHEAAVGEHVRLRAQPAIAGKRRRIGMVVVGISMVPYDDTEHVALAATVALDLCVLLAGALLARAAVGVALRPVATMTARAADWSIHDLGRRFNLGPPRDELGVLSTTLDGLLDRIGASLRREQRLSAEMAHELRTPLSGVRGEAELALAEPDLPPSARGSFEQILRATDRMNSVIDTLLAAARRDAATAVEAADPVAAATAAADAVRSHAEQDGVRLQIVPPDGDWRVGADEDLVAQALQPLLDNAVRHAAGAVVVTLARNGAAATFAVEDDGPGLDGADLDAIFQPGASSAGGAGLGLPLARRLARACGGDVVAVRRAGGGRFELRLPLIA